MPPADGLRKASVVLFWVTTAATALFALAAFQRKSTWDGFLDGVNGGSDVDDADALVAAAALLQVGLMLASTIVVSLWALRAGRKAQLAGARDVTPGLACGSWYIPIGNLVVPFIQVRRMTRVYRRPTSPAGVWQGFFIAGLVMVTSSRGQVLDPATIDVDELSDRLQMQGVLAVIGAVCFGVAAVFAARAMRNADGA